MSFRHVEKTVFVAVGPGKRESKSKYVRHIISELEANTNDLHSKFKATVINLKHKSGATMKSKADTTLTAEGGRAITKMAVT